MAYRILSLDGGGVWALIQVRALQQIYGTNTNGHAVLADFDMAVANSGGSIVLGGLVEDLPLSTILGYFETEALRRSIFQPSTQIWGLISGLIGFGPKYSAQAKLPALVSLMPNTGQTPLPQAAAPVASHLGQAPVHVLITSFDFDRNVACFFRSAQAGNANWGIGQPATATLAQAIHASSNAPVNYFDQPAAFDNSRFWDGAIAGCNNPVLAGVAEAKALGQTDIVALSIGTATTRLPGPPQPHPPSSLYAATSAQGFPIDIAKLAGSVTDDPPDVASYLAQMMAGAWIAAGGQSFCRVVRMNPMISPVSDGAGGWKPPGTWTADQFSYLANDIHLDALDQGDVDYISSYAQWWLGDIAPNQPIRMNSDTLACVLGHTTFSAALQAWNTIKGPPP